MMSRTATILRFLVCGLIAIAIFVGGGAWLVHHYLGDKPKDVIGMKIVRGLDLITTIPGVEGTAAKALQQDKAQRFIPGFVQIAFTVGKDGRAHNIHVVRAIPEGRYELAATAVIAARHFKPPESAQAAAKERTEIVHFSAAESGHSENGAASDGGG